MKSFPVTTDAISNLCTFSYVRRFSNLNSARNFYRNFRVKNIFAHVPYTHVIKERNHYTLYVFAPLTLWPYLIEKYNYVLNA